MSIPHCVIYRGDASKREDLTKFGKLFSPFDVVLDDASHASHHQQITLATLFPFLKSGGMYIIEDLHWQPKELEQDCVS